MQKNKINVSFKVNDVLILRGFFSLVDVNLTLNDVILK